MAAIMPHGHVMAASACQSASRGVANVFPLSGMRWRDHVCEHGVDADSVESSRRELADSASMREPDDRCVLHVHARISQRVVSRALRRVVRCAFEPPQGEGRVTTVIDARSFRLDDGREVRLSGIEPADKAKGAAALSTVLLGRDVTLRGEDDTPDRYGRQPAFVFIAGSDTPVQAELLKRGDAMVSAEVADKDCAAMLSAAEAGARQAKTGTWADFDGHKKRRKSGRYFGRDRALYRGRGQGFVRAAGGGNDLCQFWPELDSGLCCDYFKAHDWGIRGDRRFG